MKRIWIAAIVLFAIISCCIWDTIFVDKIINNLHDQLDKAQNIAKTSELNNTLELVNNTYGDWIKGKDVFALFVSHDTLEAINQSFVVLLSYIENDESSDFFAENSKIASMLEQLKDTEFLTLKNIL